MNEIRCHVEECIHNDGGYCTIEPEIDDSTQCKKFEYPPDPIPRREE